MTPAIDPNGTEGVAYSAYFEGTGGLGPYTWSISSGSLPSGVSLSSSENFGYLSGTPTSSGSFEFTVEATDSATPKPNVASVDETLTITAAGPLEVTTNSVPDGKQERVRRYLRRIPQNARDDVASVGWDQSVRLVDFEWQPADGSHSWTPTAASAGHLRWPALLTSRQKSRIQLYRLRMCRPWR